MSNALSNITDIKLTAKQLRILNAYDNEDNKGKSPYEIAKIADVSPRYVYDCLQDYRFVNALRVRTSGLFVSSLLPISKKVIKDSLAGKFMQQQLSLQIAGITAKEPLINVIINQQAQPSSDLDNKIIEKIIDITPEPSSVDNPTLEHTDTE